MVRGMYPFIRLAYQFWLHRKSAPLALTETHVSHHYCLPWDLDLWRELNNGRTLTLFDMGRLPLAKRVGLIETLKRERWALTMAGVVVRYRKRVRMFDKVEMRSRAIGWDDKFVYLEQAMFLKNGECANHAIYRSAVTDRNGIVRPPRLMAAMGVDTSVQSPDLPDWVQTWVTAEDTRPWPPAIAPDA